MNTGKGGGCFNVGSAAERRQDFSRHLLVGALRGGTSWLFPFHDFSDAIEKESLIERLFLGEAAVDAQRRPSAFESRRSSQGRAQSTEPEALRSARRAA